MRSESRKSRHASAMAPAPVAAGSAEVKARVAALSTRPTLNRGAGAGPVPGMRPGYGTGRALSRAISFITERNGR